MTRYRKFGFLGQQQGYGGSQKDLVGQNAEILPCEGPDEVRTERSVHHHGRT